MKKLKEFINNPENLKGVPLKMVISMCGGKFQDGHDTSKFFRKILSLMDWVELEKFIHQCIDDKQKKEIPEAGFALQDIVNELGSRLDFDVEHGVYRGSSNPDKIGLDGLWSLSNGKKLLIEVKSSEIHQIDLGVATKYREQLEIQGKLKLKDSAILYVFANEKTENTEAQIRGSKWAWDIRVISVNALSRLVKLKTKLEEPRIVNKIQDALFPKQFTKLDNLFQLLFDVDEDKLDVDESEHNENGHYDLKATREKGADWNMLCIKEIEKKKGFRLLPKTRTAYLSPDSAIAVVCLVGSWSDKNKEYWFSIRDHHYKFLHMHNESYLALGCGSNEQLFLVPFQKVLYILPNLKTSPPDVQFDKVAGWHIKIRPKNNNIEGDLIEASKLVSHPKFNLDDFRL